MATETPTKRFASDTLTALHGRGLTVGWLARRIGVADSTLRFQLSNPDTIKLRVAFAITRELGVAVKP